MSLCWLRNCQKTFALPKNVSWQNIIWCLRFIKLKILKNREMHVYHVQWFMWIYCVLTSLAFHPIILFMAQFVFILIVSDLRAQLKKPLVSFCVFFFPVGVLYQNCTSVSFVHPTMGIIYKQIKITQFYLHPSFSYCL